MCVPPLCPSSVPSHRLQRLTVPECSHVHARADFLPPVLAVYVRIKAAQALGYSKGGLLPRMVRWCKVAVTAKNKTNMHANARV